VIVFINPRATRPKNRRFPLSIMAVGAALPPDVSWEIVDGNRPNVDPSNAVGDLVARQQGGADPVRVIALTVMPGPQLTNAVPLSRALKAKHPDIPIVWGGYFPSLYPHPVLNSSYIDWIVRGQGEHTFAELLEVLNGNRDPAMVAGLGYRRADGTHALNPERLWVGPADLPRPPYHKIPVDEYLQPTFLGSRSGVYQASIGCPYGCSFCGVISVFGSREKVLTPERTAADLEFLVKKHGMNGLHFYDNNFFVREEHALELCERIAPLNINWWCEARVDALLRFSAATWEQLRKAGLRMIFFGAESGSNEVLRKMNKKLTVEQTLEVAARSREHNIIPEFSFVLGDPDEPVRELENTLAFVRKLKVVNPALELITYFYTPTPQRRGTYGQVDALAGTPDTLEEWIEPQWVDWSTHENPDVPWLTPEMKARVHDFEVVLKSRFPSLHDRYVRTWGKRLARVLARRRWESGNYSNPQLLKTVRRWASIAPEDRQAYGHLTPAKP
jgi:anaerobic magnesium-protoporphyrin IX monomethyl ester cyclase